MLPGWKLSGSGGRALDAFGDASSAATPPPARWRCCCCLQRGLALLLGVASAFSTTGTVGAAVSDSPEVCVRIWRMVTGFAFTSLPFSITCLSAYDGSQLSNRIVEQEAAFFPQHHQRGRDDRLGHRLSEKIVSLLHGRVVFLVAVALRLEVDDLAVPRDERHPAGDLVPIHVALDERVDLLEALGGDSYRFRLRHRHVRVRASHHLSAPPAIARAITVRTRREPFDMANLRRGAL